MKSGAISLSRLSKNCNFVSRQLFSSTMLLTFVFFFIHYWIIASIVQTSNLHSPLGSSSQLSTRLHSWNLGVLLLSRGRERKAGKGRRQEERRGREGRGEEERKIRGSRVPHTQFTFLATPLNLQLSNRSNVFFVPDERGIERAELRYMYHKLRRKLRRTDERTDGVAYSAGFCQCVRMHFRTLDNVVS